MIKKSYVVSVVKISLVIMSLWSSDAHAALPSSGPIFCGYGLEGCIAVGDGTQVCERCLRCRLFIEQMGWVEGSVSCELGTVIVGTA